MNYIIILFIVILVLLLMRSDISSQNAWLIVVATGLFMMFNKKCKKVLVSMAEGMSVDEQDEIIEEKAADKKVEQSFCVPSRGCKTIFDDGRSFMLGEQNKYTENEMPSYLYNSDPYPWMSNQGYSGCYKSTPYEINACNLNAYRSADERSATMAVQRTRDKKCMDGLVSKTANYYKKNFGRELDQAENKRWWSLDEY